jgi:hypothetical protein
MPMKTVSRILLVGGIVFLIGAGLLLAFHWRDICIAYHRRSMVTAFENIHRVGPNGREQSKYIDSFENHRDALESLGYFVRFKVNLRHIKPGTDSWRALFMALQGEDYSCERTDFEMSGYEPETERAVVVWCLPSLRQDYEKLIMSYDAPEH